MTGVSRRVAGVGVVVVLVCAVLDVGGAPAWAAGACPNEALRLESSLSSKGEPFSAQLPDCRAYELVSPPYTGGSRIEVFMGVSEDGSRVLATSLGGFAGTEDNGFDAGFGNPYELVRGDAGWVASGLAPNPARFPLQALQFNAVSKDLTRSIWALREPSQSIYAEDFYVREPNGVFVKVGPIVPPLSGPPAGYSTLTSGANRITVGASSDLSHVLFTIVSPPPGKQSFLWPGDTTAPTLNSLYEYVGVGDSRPDLVGVSDGRTVLNSSEHPLQALPEGVLLSDCEASLGGPSITSSNARSAVSVDGETVFFTARAKGAECENNDPAAVGPAVSELYARIGGSQTVAISEPTPAQCEKCKTAPMVTDGAAKFQGASEDGSKAFFMTEQELLGTKGEALYEYDFDNVSGRKIVAVSGGVLQPEVQGVARISRDGSHVYFVARGVLASTNGEGSAPTLHADNLYVFERDGEYPQGRIAFVTTLCSGEGESGEVSDSQCHGSDQEDWEEETLTYRVQATPDGRFLVFKSAGDLTSDDTSTKGQIFEYDALREKLVRVSVGQRAAGVTYECPVTKVMEAGYNCDGNIQRGREEPRLPTSAGPLESGGLAVSHDGSFVFFSGRDGLTPGALDNEPITEFEESTYYAYNVYEYHSNVASAGGSIADGNVYLISDGQDRTLTESFESSVKLLGTDASGYDVFFGSGDRLVGQDTDTQLDVYDARVDGGFPAPVSPVECAGERCLPGASSTPSLFGSPGSVAAKGGGNLTPLPPAAVVVKPKPKSKPAKCRKGFTRKHNKCVKNTSKRKARKAGNERGVKR